MCLCVCVCVCVKKISVSGTNRKKYSKINKSTKRFVFSKIHLLIHFVLTYM